MYSSSRATIQAWAETTREVTCLEAARHFSVSSFRPAISGQETWVFGEAVL
jgi:hypothetical protein